MTKFKFKVIYLYLNTKIFVKVEMKINKQTVRKHQLYI
jgi:hypothetical protein